MIRHIVFFSAKDAADIPRIQKALARLGNIPESVHFEVALNSKHDAISSEVDIVVYAEFQDYEALERYKQHPEYHEAIRVVRPLRELRLAADFPSVAGQKAD